MLREVKIQLFAGEWGDWDIVEHAFASYFQTNGNSRSLNWRAPM